MASGLDADTFDGLNSTDFVRREGAQFIDLGVPSRDPDDPCGVNPNQWIDDKSDEPGIGYFRAPDGMVFMEGGAERCGPANVSIGTLPPGYRLAYGQDFIVSA